MKQFLKVRLIESGAYFSLLVILLGWLAYIIWKIGIDLTYNVSDIPYHLSVSSGFLKAGGIVTWDFWESLPLGRAHNYPPLFHLIFANALKAGISPTNTAKLMMEFTIIFGAAIYAWGVAKLFSLKTAFISTLLVVASFYFIRYSATVMPATLAMFSVPLLFYCFQKKRWISYVTLLVLLFYLHLFMPFIILFGFLLHVLIFDRKMFWQWLVATAIAFFFYLPWFFHVVMGGFEYLKYFDGSYSIADSLSWPKLNLIVYFFAIVELIIFLKKDYHKTSSEKFFWVLSAVFLAVAFFSSNRIINGNLLLLASLMGALALINLSKNEFLKWTLLILIVISCCFDTIYLRANAGIHFVAFARSTMANTFEPETATIFYKNDYDHIGKIIEENTKNGDSIVSMVSLYGNPKYDKFSQMSVANYWASKSGLFVLNMRQPEIFHRPSININDARILITSTPLSDINAETLDVFGYVSDERAVDLIRHNFVLLSSCSSSTEQKIYFYVNSKSNTVRGEVPSPVVPLCIADTIVVTLIVVCLLGSLKTETKQVRTR